MKPPRTFAKIRGFLGRFTILCLFLIPSASLRAQDIYNQPFASPQGGIPAGWTRNGGFQSTQGVSEIVTDGSHTWLRQQRTDGARGNSFVYFKGNFGTVVDGFLSDFSASVILKVTGGLSGDGRGMMVRAGGSGAVPTGYYVFIAENRLKITLNPTDASSGRGTVLATSTESFGDLISGSEYCFTVSAKGETISASLYAWSTETSGFSTLLAEISTENSSHASGYFGLRTSFTNDARSAFWRDAKITVAPEPSTTALLIPSGGL